MTSKVEQVARAICFARQTCEYCKTHCLASPEDLAKSNKPDLARAAIAAMEGP